MSALKSQRHPVLVRFDTDLLAKIERIAKRKCISRNAFIQFVLSTALEKAKI